MGESFPSTVAYWPTCTIAISILVDCRIFSYQLVEMHGQRICPLLQDRVLVAVRRQPRGICLWHDRHSIMIVCMGIYMLYGYMARYSFNALGTFHRSLPYAFIFC
jgi:hypothetical protein